MTDLERDPGRAAGGHHQQGEEHGGGGQEWHGERQGALDEAENYKNMYKPRCFIERESRYSNKI